MPIQYLRRCRPVRKDKKKEERREEPAEEKCRHAKDKLTSTLTKAKASYLEWIQLYLGLLTVLLAIVANVGAEGCM